MVVGRCCLGHVELLEGPVEGLRCRALATKGEVQRRKGRGLKYFVVRNWRVDFHIVGDFFHCFLFVEEWVFSGIFELAFQVCRPAENKKCYFNCEQSCRGKAVVDSIVERWNRWESRETSETLRQCIADFGNFSGEKICKHIFYIRKISFHRWRRWPMR